MKPSRVRLAVAAVAFGAWIAYLGVLAWTTARPVVVSRPQFLAADAYVLAELTAGEGDVPAAEAQVAKVIWSAPTVNIPVGRIRITNLTECGLSRGWDGAGEYALALTRGKAAGEFFLTLIPRSPGYFTPAPRIYKNSPRVLRQVEDLKAEFHGG